MNASLCFSFYDIIGFFFSWPPNAFQLPSLNSYAFDVTINKFLAHHHCSRKGRDIPLGFTTTSPLIATAEVSRSL